MTIAAPAEAKLVVFARDIKLSHSVFALPFALLATFLAAGGWPGLGRLGLIVVCMVTARTVAMSANRLLDAKLDAQNPRTAGRAIPSGRLSRGFVLAMLLGCAACFVFATALFQFMYGNPWPLRLSAPVLGFVAAYPLLKRFTAVCHWYLGAALALAPLCAWVAIGGGWSWTPLLLGAAVLLWTAGFDVIYACQDVQSDRVTGVFSVPAVLGVRRALWISRITHLLSAAALAAAGLSSPMLGGFYAVGVLIAAGLLVIEHRLVKADDLSKVGVAFFTMNGIVSLVVGVLGIVDVVSR